MQLFDTGIYPFGREEFTVKRMMLQLACQYNISRYKFRRQKMLQLNS